jgi:DHA2 family multidrug resistance protein
VLHHSQLAEQITPYNPTAQAAIDQLGHGDTQLGGSAINDMITQQAYQISFNELFQALGWIFLSLVFVIWLTKPPFSAKGSAAAGGH